MSAPILTTDWHSPTSGADMAKRARELFDRAKQANDPESRDVLSAAAWYWADRAEREGVHHG